MTSCQHESSGSGLGQGSVALPGEVPQAYTPERTQGSVFPRAPQPLPVPIVDNHTHMDMHRGGAPVAMGDALDTAQALGVRGVVQVGCDLASSQWAVEAAQADHRVLAAVALHPNEIPALAQAGELEGTLEAIAQLATDNRVRAIGETGLDYFRTSVEHHGLQQEAFREHIRLAKSLGKALQIHDRDAHDDVVRILLEEGAPERTVFHCFSGDADLARICNTRGWYMSFSGTVTFKNSRDLQSALHVARPDLVMVETDAPFLTPHPYRGDLNAPYLVAHTARWIAAELDCPLEDFCRRVDSTVRSVYGDHGHG